MAVATERACPQCGTTLPVADGYVTWCHECDWNLNAPEPIPTPGRLGRIYDAAGRRLGERLAARLLAEERLEPRLTPAKLAAYGVALFVHAFWLGLGVGGIALVALTFPNPFLIAAGALMAAAAILMRPRFGELPEEGTHHRGEVPTLYALADDVAEALATPRVDVVAVDHSFNASWSIVGIRRKRVLRLGGPLLAGLEPQERVALVAHELAHARNGDSTRGLIVGSAIGALEQLYLLLAPDQGGEWEFNGIDALANGAMWVLSRPVLGLLLLELHLVLRDSQRAEFLADALAAEVAGTEPTVALSEKTLLEPTFRSVVQHAAHGDVEPGEVLRDVTRAFTSVPPRERERRRRVARLEAARLFASHPPMAQRIRLLEERAAREPRVVLDAARAAALDRELVPLAHAIGRRLVDEQRDSLYY